MPIIDNTHPGEATCDELLAIWESAVRATHHFLTEGDIVALRPDVQEAVSAVDKLFVYTDSDGIPIGFIGLEDQKIEMLFVHDRARGMGVGKALITYAIDTLDARFVDVNEDNPSGAGFYHHMGFETVGRSETDDAGRPFPILHMALTKERSCLHFTPIDYGRWERREILEFFGSTSAYYLTVDIDITEPLARLRREGLRLYPALIHSIAGAVNSHDCFKYGKNAAGEIGLWNVLHPLYTLPRATGPELFSMMSTPYTPDFEAFYGAFISDYARAETCGKLVCDELPPNPIGITAVTNLSFKGFGFGDEGGKPDFTPFAVIGRYEEANGRVLLPLCGEFNHAVNDGHHAALYFEAVRDNLHKLLR